MDSFRVYDGALPWTPEEIQAMLSIWADSAIQLELESSVRNEKVFLRIASDLAAMGFLRSAKQCREKVKKLKQEYRKLKDHSIQGGRDRKGGTWFNLMDSVLGTDRPPPATGDSLLSNSAEAILEAMSSPFQTSEDSALTGDEPIVEVQILGDEQPPIIQPMPDERLTSHVPAVSRANGPAVKRKRSLCSSDEWKKIIAESDMQYVGVLHRMLESESQHRREELRMRKEEVELKRADAQLMKEEASSSSAVQGQLVGVLGQIGELFRARQAALCVRDTAVSPGGHAPSSSAVLQSVCQARGQLFTMAKENDGRPGAERHQTATAETCEDAQPRWTQNLIKTEVEEVIPLRTDAGPVNMETVPTQCEEGQAHGATQGASASAVQRGLLATQREHCRLMAEQNRLQRTLLRAVSRSNRCASELARSVRAQAAASAGVQDRIVQLLERQEWTNQLLTMKIMGVSSPMSQNLQELRSGLPVPAAGRSSIFPNLFPGQETVDLSSTSAATHHSNTL